MGSKEWFANRQKMSDAGRGRGGGAGGGGGVGGRGGGVGGGGREGVGVLLRRDPDRPRECRFRKK